MADISYSSVETQRALRIEKVEKLRKRGIDPYPPDSHRSIELAYLKFWFDVILKGDYLTKVGEIAEKHVDFFGQNPIVEDLAVELFESVFDLEMSYTEEITEDAIDVSEMGDLKDAYISYLNDTRKLVLEMRGLLDLENLTPEDVTKYIDSLVEYKEGKTSFTLSKDTQITLSGRVKSKRLSGKIGFTTVEDESYPEGFQFIFKKDQLPEDQEGNQLTFKDLKSLIDEGDYIQATGTLDYSQRGEPSLFVSEYNILTKSLRPLPEKLEDIEQKYRQRYVDMKLNPEVRDLFIRKSRFWSATRQFLVDHGFLEVQVPTMEHTTGGAEATPFTTHHNALDEDFYLRISSELHLKRYIVGGFEKVFDIDKNFRNEGIDDEHLQEYTQCEFYWAYADYNDLIEFTEEMFKYMIQAAFGTLELSKNGKVIDWSKPWPRIPYYEFVEKYAGINLAEYDTIEKLRKLADELGLSYEDSDGQGRLIDLIYKKTARPKCIEPVWLTDQPVEISPLAKRIPDQPELTQRMQLIAYGSELCNGFSELNDPIDQLERFNEQQRLRDAGDDEAMMIDYDYVRALEVAMPPTAGFGFSERVFSVLSEKSIRECAPFPAMKADPDVAAEYGVVKKAVKKVSSSQKTDEDQKVENDNFGNEVDSINVGKTRLLCLEDNTYLFECKAKVVQTGTLEEKQFVILDQTVFYPQGGGQPSDVGDIESKDVEFNVEKCQIIDDVVYHFGSYSKGEFQDGDAVEVEIDEDARRLHARIHTAGHVIDEALNNLGIDVEPGKGYHFVAGPYVEYIGEVDNSEEGIQKIETEVNRLIKEDLKISYKIYDTKHANGKPNRMMYMGEYTPCPCGGTHVPQLLDIGSVKIRKIKNKKGRAKVSYEVV